MTIQKQMTSMMAFVALLGISNLSQAVPISGQYNDLPGCDNHGIVGFDEEIGDVAVFPTDEAIFFDAMQTTDLYCVTDDGIPNDWEIRMVNLSPNSFIDVFFVADEGSTIGNRDGQIQDLSVVGSGSTDAFKIDDVGLNAPLIGDDGDLIFEPGESWTFYVTNFFTPGGILPPIVSSPGAFAGTSFDPMSNASIVANLYNVPEPASCLLMAAGLACTALRRR